MITRHTIRFSGGHEVVPRVRVAAGKATLLELPYVWEGTSGTIPQLSFDLHADLALEKIFLAAVYKNDAGERKVVVDAQTVDMAQTALTRAGQSADSVLAQEGWTRCFLVFQVFVPPGLMGVVEDENTSTQVFEYVSGAPDV